MRSIDRCRTVGAVVFSLALAAAAPAHAQATREVDPKPMKVKANGDLITAQQLASRHFPDAYQAIEALHSNWLRARNLNPPSGSLVNPGGTATTRAGGGGASATGLAAGTSGMPGDASGIQVYLDGTRLGGIETLKGLPVTGVYTMRRISGTDAQARYGIGHSDGVIFIATGPNKESK